MIDCNIDSKRLKMVCEGNVVTLLSDLARITCAIQEKLPDGAKNAFRTCFIYGAIDGVFFGADKQEMQAVLKGAYGIAEAQEQEADESMDKLLDDLTSLKKQLREAQDKLEELQKGNA